MFSRPRSYSVLYGIQRSLLNIFYLISAVSLFWLIFYLLREVLQFGGRVIIPVSILYLVVIVLGYSIIQVISYIPANLAGAFDPIKNGVAERSIRNRADLAGELANFMCRFFDFAFFDIRFALVRIQDEEAVPSADLDLEKTELEPGRLEEFAAGLEGTALFGKVKTMEGPVYLYVTPLVFGEKRIGYMAVATRQKLWNIFKQLLNEFENDYLDDQVVHILARSDVS